MWLYADDICGEICVGGICTAACEEAGWWGRWGEETEWCGWCGEETEWCDWWGDETEWCGWCGDETEWCVWWGDETECDGWEWTVWCDDTWGLEIAWTEPGGGWWELDKWGELDTCGGYADCEGTVDATTEGVCECVEYGKWVEGSDWLTYGGPYALAECAIGGCEGIWEL